MQASSSTAENDAALEQQAAAARTAVGTLVDAQQPAGARRGYAALAEEATRAQGALGDMEVRAHCHCAPVYLVTAACHLLANEMPPR